jgi:glyoxylase-like metal-dependent hydrolase (beta-lactamase superfamily II)
MIKIFENGLLGSNTFLYCDLESKEAMIIDCGNMPGEILSFCKENNLKVKYIALTHGHCDHIHYVGLYKSIFENALIVCHKDELPLLFDPEANVSSLMGAPTVYPQPDKTVVEGDTLSVGNTDFKVIHSPGHTPGGICLYCEKEKIMFTGDTLFANGRGRTDFKYGSETELLKSLSRLTAMDGDITFYSGHGMSSMIKYEKGTY